MRISKKAAGLILLIILINWILGFCLQSASYMNITLRDLQNSEENFDIVFVGQSHGSNAFNPYIIEETTGLPAYNLCRALVCNRDLEYLVKESNYKNDVKYIVYDIDGTYWTSFEYPNYFSDGYVFPHLNNPLNKMDYLFEYALDENYRYNLFRYVVYGTGGLKAVPENIREKLSKGYWEGNLHAIFTDREKREYQGRGFFAGSVKDEGDFVPAKWNDADVKEDSLQGFLNMVEYCKKNDIEFICVSSPLPQKRVLAENYPAFHQYFAELAKSQDVVFWDFNYIKEDYLVWDEDDFQDSDGHMFGSFANKYSKVLGDMLNKHINGGSVDEYFGTDYIK